MVELSKNKLKNLMTVALFSIFSITTSAGASAGNSSYRFRCQSNELGIIEMVLSSEKQTTLGCVNFDIDLTRYDLNRNLIEKRHHSEADPQMDHTFNARFCKGDPSVSIHVPVSNIDWSAHRHECWANSPYVGANLDLDAASGMIHHLPGNKTFYTLQGLNPSVTFEWVNRGWGYKVLAPFLDGRDCRQDTADSKLAAPEPSCQTF